VRSRDMVVTLDGSGARAAGNPIKMPGVEPEYRAPPKLGEHNERILRERVR